MLLPKFPSLSPFPLPPSLPPFPLQHVGLVEQALDVQPVNEHELGKAINSLCETELLVTTACPLHALFEARDFTALRTVLDKLKAGAWQSRRYGCGCECLCV